jgi:hypothetical protein
VLSTLPDAARATRAAVSADAGTPAGTVVIPSRGLRFHGWGTVLAGGPALRSGEMAVFCRPVVTAPALVKRDGTVLADAWLPDLVRLGELERHLGDRVIEAVVDAALASGRLRPRQRRRLLSYPLVIRLAIAMTLMPDSSYWRATARLAGLLERIPFVLEWHVPTETAVTGWRLLIPADVMENVFWHAAGPLIADGEDPSAVTLAGMTVLAADGTLVNLADTEANLKAFGSAGTADGTGPFPQMRIIALTARAGRAIIGAVLGSWRAGEQTLLKRLVRRRPFLFAGRVTCFDRCFPGHGLVQEIRAAGGHVVPRASATLSLPMDDDGGWLPDGSRLSWLNAPSGRKEDRIRIRVCEHNAIMPGPAGTSRSRRPAPSSLPSWTGKPPPLTMSGTRTLPGGPRRRPRSARTRPRSPEPGTGPPGPCSARAGPRLVVQEAWAWLAGT